MVEGVGVAYGAITVVNAIPAFKGAAIGVDLKVVARVKLVEKEIVEGRSRVRGKNVHYDTSLLEGVLRVLKKRIGLETGLIVEIESEIPACGGLKTSSAVANAVIAGISDALDLGLPPLKVAEMSAEANLISGVSITGAFDDACASLLGGLCITDNGEKKLVKRVEVPSFKTIILAPSFTVKKSHLKIERLKLMKTFFEKIWNIALSGDWREALFLNGILCSLALGYDTSLALEAITRGAVTAGLSGTGPAIAIVGDVVEWARKLNFKGEVVETCLRG
ncbi:MAG: shikimate kinase [Thermoprotei archaeon]|nr:MAG: shikimate kinase [Thermoprotei archaeon]